MTAQRVPPCQACRGVLTAGEALRCVDLTDGTEYAVHRPSLIGACMRITRTANDTLVELWDVAAARRFDSQWARSEAPVVGELIEVMR